MGTLLSLNHRPAVSPPLRLTELSISPPLILPAAHSEREFTPSTMEKDWLDPRSAQNARQSEKPADVEGNLLAENAAAMKSSNAGYVSRTRAPRKLVLCFDGTGNKFHGDDSDSNILKIFRMLDRTAGDQYHYYQRKDRLVHDRWINC